MKRAPRKSNNKPLRSKCPITRRDFDSWVRDQIKAHQMSPGIASILYEVSGERNWPT